MTEAQQLQAWITQATDRARALILHSVVAFESKAPAPPEVAGLNRLCEQINQAHQALAKLTMGGCRR